MRKKFFYAALLLSVSIPAAALYCNYSDRTVCQLYDICKQVLDAYPEAAITEKGKDCTLTIDNRQLIIRRKRTDGRTGYFLFRKVLSPGHADPFSGAEESLAAPQGFAPAAE